MVPDCLAERVGWALRARACRCAAAPVEQGSKARTLLGKNAKGPERGLLHFGDAASPLRKVLAGGSGPVRSRGGVTRVTTLRLFWNELPVNPSIAATFVIIGGNAPIQP